MHVFYSVRSCLHVYLHVPHFALMFQWLYDSNFASDSHHPVGETKEACEEISASVEVCRSEGGGTEVERCDKTSRKPFPNSHKKTRSNFHCALQPLAPPSPVSHKSDPRSRYPWTEKLQQFNCPVITEFRWNRVMLFLFQSFCCTQTRSDSPVFIRHVRAGA